jgi:exopolysaccharide biosynthesis protein
MNRKVVSRIIISVFLISVLPQFSLAQQDSLNVVRAKWQTKKIARGIKLKHCWFDRSLYGSNQNINILEVKMNRRNRIDVAGDAKELQPTSRFASENKALAAVNGTFFNMTNGGSHDYIRVDGKMINVTTLGKKGRSLHQKSALVTDNGRLAIRAWDSTAQWEESIAGEDVMVTGPLLINNGRRTPLDTTSMYTIRHPRTAVAVRGNKVLLITVDGRSERAAGMSFYELASLLKWLGAEEGINLDGGGSTTMWFDGFPDGGIINQPSDRTGERHVANVLLVNKKK